jgi:hypothetical protein
MTALLAHWAIASLVAHLAYGAVLGAIAAEQKSREREHDYLIRCSAKNNLNT